MAIDTATNLSQVVDGQPQEINFKPFRTMQVRTLHVLYPQGHDDHELMDNNEVNKAFGKSKLCALGSEKGAGVVVDRVTLKHPITIAPETGWDFTLYAKGQDIPAGGVVIRFAE